MLNALTPEILHQELAVAVYDKLLKSFEKRSSRSGRLCLRITTLPRPVMSMLCQKFVEDGIDADVVMLIPQRHLPQYLWEVSATRLIELRNKEDRKPLLAFVPPGIKVAAEDSFDVSTFGECDLSAIPKEIAAAALKALPEDLQKAIRKHLLPKLREARIRIDDDDLLNYYLTIHVNEGTLQAAGGAVYHLGMIPDFALFERADIQTWVERNLKVVKILSDSTQPLLSRIHDLRLKENTLQLDFHRFLREQINSDDVRAWGTVVANESPEFAFDQWQFEGEATESEEVALYVDDPELPISPDPERIFQLDMKRAKSLSVKWKTNPKPTLVRGLSHFRIEIVSSDGTTVWESSNIAVGTSVKDSRSKTIKLDSLREWIEDGIYFVRVNAYSQTGDNVCQSIPRNPENPEGKQINETADIWFWKDDQGDPPPAEPERNVAVNSFLDAKLQAQFAAMDRGDDPFDSRLTPIPDRTGWATSKTEKRAQSTYHIIYDSQVRFTLAVSSILRKLEDEILANPSNLGMKRAEFRSRTEYEVSSRILDGGAPKVFLQAREELFKAIRQTEKDEIGITATADLLQFEDVIIRKYVNEYHKWLNKNITPLALDIDTVEVIIPGEGRRPVRVFLLAPTHPLRLMWHLQRGRIARDWLERALRLGRKLNKEQRLYLREKLAPINFPPILRINGEHFTEQGALTPFWGLYVAEGTTDSRALRARVQRYLGIGRQDYGALGGINKGMLLGKLSDFLSQHPHISIFKINVFNPGDAAPLVDTILDIEKQRKSADLPSLSYNVRLFTGGSILGDIGEAVDNLRNPDTQVTEEADDFSIRSRNHLFPKLRYSKNTVDDFLRTPTQYEAHITILHDFFPVSVTYEPKREGRSSYVHGLVQEPVTFFTGDSGPQQEFSWMRQLIPAGCPEIGHDQTQASTGIASAFSLIMKAQAKAAGAADNGIPSLTIRLELRDKSLLYQIHDVSQWVITFDRYLGFDYFDTGVVDNVNRVLYLLDFRPEFSAAETYRMLLTTRSTDEFRHRIRGAFQDYGVKNVSEAMIQKTLNTLRAISGRLCFRLMSAVNVGEFLGLASSYLWLKSQRGFSKIVLIPLDSHSDLLSGLDEGDSWQRSDFLVVSANQSQKRVLIDVVEIKWRKPLTDEKYAALCHDEIEPQLRASMNMISKHFAPENEHIDQAMRHKMLISLILFYLERARRHRLVAPDVADRLTEFYRGLDSGFSLTVRGIGITFDLGFAGTKKEQPSDDLIFFRLGKPVLTELYAEPSESSQGENQQLAFPLPGAENTEEQQGESNNITEVVSTEGESNEDSLAVDTNTVSSEVQPTPRDDAEAYEESDPEQPQELQPEADDPLQADVMLGESAASAQYGILGQVGDKFVGLDLNGTNTISLFGVQGGGKSYTLGAIVEMATKQFLPISQLPAPLASVIFHYHDSQDYPPELVSMIAPNNREQELHVLRTRYGAEPGCLDDVLLLSPIDKIAQRQQEFPSLTIAPISFASRELQARDWLFLMGTGNQMYMKQITMIMRQLRAGITLESLQASVDASPLAEPQKEIARQRLAFAAQFIDDSRNLSSLLQPGRLLIVDLRDEFIGKDEALGLFVVMLNIFANAGREFNKLIVFDEAHKYMGNPELSEQIASAIRQMRHQGVSIVLASQDPMSLPNSVIELSSVIIMHRFNSPRWLKHIQKSIVALGDLTPEKMAALKPGEAYVWASKATSTHFTQRAMKVTIRPRVTLHGGATTHAQRKSEE